MREHVPDLAFAQEPVGFDIEQDSRIVPGKRTRTMLLPRRNAEPAARPVQSASDDAQELELARDAGGVLDRCGGSADDPFWFAEGTDTPAHAAIVDGEVVRPGQMNKHAFLAELRTAVEQTATPATAPAIPAFFEHQARRSAAQVERLMRHHAGRWYEDARDYVEPVRARLASDVAG